MEFFGERSVDLVVVVSFVLGGLVILVAFIFLRTGTQKNKYVRDRKSHVESENSEPVTSTSANSQLIPPGGGKRAKNKKRREAQQEFTHSWMVGALKGHTGPVLDMNFSSDGKFLASCAEDCGLVPEDLEEGAASSASPESPVMSTSSSTTSSSSMEEAAPKERDRAILSRRQRKNRTRATREQRRDREDDPEDDTNPPPPPRHRHHHRLQQHDRRYLTESPTRSSDSGTSNSAKNIRKQESAGKNRNTSESSGKSESKSVNQTSKITGVGGKKSRNSTAKRSHQRIQLNHLSDADLATLLRRYALSGMELVHLGYPVECSYYPGYAVILNHHPMGHHNRNDQQQQQHHHLDVNAQEFVPSTNSNSGESEIDSGNGSGSSVDNSDLEPESLSDSDKSSDIVESSSSSSSSSDYSENTRRDSTSTPDTWGPPESPSPNAVERPCVRCTKCFYINRTTGHYITDERCTYHWGKLRNASIGYEWECCNGRESARGCTTAKVHVWTGLGHGFNGPFTGYARTRPSRVIPRDGNYGVYALDCEMCFTRRGLELAKVTVVGINGDIVYDTLVKPDDDVLDYNTRFSGITAKALSSATKTLADVQKDLTNFIHAETILIGHGLENDLRALKILHTTVIDTCVAFPHYLGYPYRSSLKTLAKRLLKREIQVSKHDSVEDAKSAVDLMLRRVELDLGRT
ncbi:uncharacterized protein prage isoform X1 [Fopius arisanus]|uniref:Uncharacterized protein prage isoform X1 n=1 Tax=Fopius arisanus TaxID=64838 RepID=A0A9R1TDH4_9HYME|nr:PREDICTED: uncharacterized protein LOC105269238 isoform X1 [Fopius arisanus]